MNPSPWPRLRHRLRHDRAARLAFVVLCVLSLAALSTPILLRFGVLHPYAVHYELVRSIGSLPSGNVGGISFAHPLGVEPLLGRDVLSRLLLAMSLSMLVAVCATVLAVLIGATLGITAGYLGGPIDHVIGRTTDLVLAFPALVMLLALSPVLRDRIDAALPGSGAHQIATPTIYLTLVLGLFGWPSFARTVRGQVLVLRERGFVDATRSMGATRRRIVFVKLPPHLSTPLLVFVPLNLRHCIAAEATLTFLGVGYQPPIPSFGTLLNISVNYVRTDPEFFIVPSALLLVIVISCTVLADGLRDALATSRS
jgi:peptide/nickel transport system permease protein